MQLTQDLLKVLLNFRNFNEEIIEILHRAMHNELELVGRADLFLQSNAFLKTLIMSTAIKLGIFEYLSNKSATLQQIAKDLKLNKKALGRLLYGLEAHTFIEREYKNRTHFYRNSKLVEAFLIKSSEYYLGNYLELINKTWNYWYQLPDVVRSGKPNTSMELFHGEKNIIYLYYEVANSIMIHLSKQLVGQLNLSNVNRVITGEVGITFVNELLNKKPEISYVIAGLEDHLPFIEKLFERFTCQKGPEEVITSKKGEASKDKWGKKEKYDLVFLYRKLAFKNYGLNYLKKAYEVLDKDGFVIVIEPTTDSLQPSMWNIADIQLMDLMVGGEEAPQIYSSDKIQEMLEGVGFRDCKKVECMGGMAIFVIGYK
ncbi:MAG: hypothetical protein HYS62_01655 [Candidatus Aenigmarchaeota archaeon]|nr:hypothetical protein [Candidatus Aenigmarchaeota archaeon]